MLVLGERVKPEYARGKTSFNRVENSGELNTYMASSPKPNSSELHRWKASAFSNTIEVQDVLICSTSFIPKIPTISLCFYRFYQVDTASLNTFVFQNVVL